jgi:predicted dehydrogenase
MEWATKAMDAGKHVLCEKPMGVNRKQVERMIECSQANRVFLMEAFWSSFNPAIREVFRRIERGDIGEVKQVQADFAFLTDAPDESRLFNPELAGGALLDIGVYPVFLAYSLLGVPERIQASSIRHRTGVDLQTAAVLAYPGALANISCGFNSTSDMMARIYGTQGSIFIEAPWHGTDGFYTMIAGEKIPYTYPKRGRGYIHEIEECVTCIAAGKTESPGWSHQDSLALIGICDEIRRQTGLSYPFERSPIPFY